MGPEWKDEDKPFHISDYTFILSQNRLIGAKNEWPAENVRNQKNIDPYLRSLGVIKCVILGEHTYIYDLDVNEKDGRFSASHVFVSIWYGYDPEGNQLLPEIDSRTINEMLSPLELSGIRINEIGTEYAFNNGVLQSRSLLIGLSRRFEAIHIDTMTPEVKHFYKPSDSYDFRITDIPLSSDGSFEYEDASYQLSRDSNGMYVVTINSPSAIKEIRHPITPTDKDLDTLIEASLTGVGWIEMPKLVPNLLQFSITS